MLTYQYALADTIIAPPITPNDSLLSGEYLKVNTASYDADITSYHDMDVTLARSPQVPNVKRKDAESLADEAVVTRSIWVSYTGADLACPRRSWPGKPSQLSRLSELAATTYGWMATSSRSPAQANGGGTAATIPASRKSARSKFRASPAAASSCARSISTDT